MRRLFRLFLILFVIPTIIGTIVLAAGGRPLAYELLQRGTTYRFPEVKWIVTRDLARWMDDSARSKPVVIDARSEPEFAVSHLKGARRMDPYKPGLDTIAAFPKDTPIVVYSSAGYRGARVASWLQEQGYPNVQNLGSSLFQWVNEGRPIFRGAQPAEVVHPYDGKWGWGWLLEGDYRAEVPAVERHSIAP
jgi:rhodanese-related sulfurtransferase